MTISVTQSKFTHSTSPITLCPACGLRQSNLTIEIKGDSELTVFRLCSGCRYKLAEKLDDCCVNCIYWRPWNVFRSHGRCNVNPKNFRYKSKRSHCNKFEREIHQ